MASKALAGYNAKLFQGATPTAVGEMRDITLNISQSEIDVTSFDSGGFKEVIGGIKEWNVDSEGLYISTDTSQTALYDALVEGTALDIVFYPKNETGATGYSGKCIVTNFEVNTTPDDAVALSVSLRGTGALTETTKVGV